MKIIPRIDGYHNRFIAIGPVYLLFSKFWVTKVTLFRSGLLSLLSLLFWFLTSEKQQEQKAPGKALLKPCRAVNDIAESVNRR